MRDNQGVKLIKSGSRGFVIDQMIVVFDSCLGIELKWLIKDCFEWLSRASRWTVLEQSVSSVQVYNLEVNKYHRTNSSSAVS